MAGNFGEVNPLLAEARRMAPSLSRGMAVVYFLRLRSRGMYIGTSLDLEQRLDDHSAGKACHTTRLDPPAHFLRIEVYGSFAVARRREAQLKGWSRAKKEALIVGDTEVLRALSRSRD